MIGTIYERDVVTWEDQQGRLRTGVAIGMITGPEGPDQVIVVHCVDDIGASAVLGTIWHVMRKAILTAEQMPDMRDFEAVEEWLDG